VDGAEFPQAKGLLISNTYVDDIITCWPYRKTSLICYSEANLNLKSNCDAVLRCVPAEDHAIEPNFTPTEDMALKVLGGHWDPTTGPPISVANERPH